MNFGILGFLLLIHVIPIVVLVTHGMGRRGKSIDLNTKLLILARHKYSHSSLRAIAHEAHTSERTVGRWVERFRLKESLDRRPGQGTKQR